MKKVMLLSLFALFAMGMALAQVGLPWTPNQTSDTLGAHNNGGRGCAGCHAPHSGGRGSGGDIQTGGVNNNTNGVAPSGAPNGIAEGDSALWGTDLYPLTSGYGTITFGGGSYPVTFNGGVELAGTQTNVITGIAVCLSCHDGNVSKGAMMMGQSYEQAWGLLPNGGGTHTTNAALYGSAPIPTLLGNDNGVAGDYNNDHPVGPAANIGKVIGVSGNASIGVTWTAGSSTISYNSGTPYATFVSNYGYFALASMKQDTTYTVPYVTCTTCHNQHLMNIYALGTGSKAASGITTGYAQTYFFINAPYNPGASWSPAYAPSTTQFCRQCHFSGHANENFGVNSVGTAY